MSEEQPHNQYQTIPAYEYVKQNILFCWFEVQKKYREYVRISGRDKNFSVSYISSEILAVYKTMLRPKMLDHKDFKEYVTTMDDYDKKDLIPKDDIKPVIDKLALFLHKIKLTDFGFEYSPFDEKFRNSYGG